MAPRLIYLDAEEEVTDLIDRLRESDQKDLGLVLPARARSLQNRLNVRLLRQYAERLGKRPSIITPDQHLQGLALDQGLPAFTSIASWEQGNQVERSALEQPAVELVVDGSAAPGLAGGTSRASFASLPRPSLPSLGRPSVGVPPRGPWYVAIAAIAVIAILFLVFWVPTATVTLAATAQNRSLNVNIVGSVNPVPADQASDHIQTRVLTSDQTASTTANSTGHRDVAAAAATGNLQFQNTNGFGLRVGSGCEVATGDNSLKFVTTEELDLPAGSPANPGSATVTGAAEVAGSGGNVGAGSITRINCGLPSGVSVDNPDPFSGGTDAKSLTLVSAADLDNARLALLSQLQNKVATDIGAHLAKDPKTGQPYEKALDSTIVDTPTVNANHQAGDEAGNFTMNVELKRSEVAINDQQIRYLIKQALRNSLGDQWTMLDTTETPVQVDYQINDAKPDGEVSIAGTASGFVVAHFDASQLRSEVAGKSPSTAATILKRGGNIQDVSIQQAPIGLPWLPWVSSRITILVKEGTPPAPPSG
jgi:hypothetical protein